MPYNDTNMGVLKNPLVKNIYYMDTTNLLISPGNSRFLVTEDLEKLQAQDGRFLTTEG